MYTTKTVEKSAEIALRHISALASYEVYLLITVAFLAAGFPVLSLLFLAGIAMVYLLGVPLRILVQSPRPGNSQATSLLKSINEHSFPSFHIARWTIASFFLGAIVQTAPFIFLLLITGVSIAVARVYLRRHYLIDVIGGILLGIIAFALVDAGYQLMLGYL